MSVIAELSVPNDDFELGRVMDLSGDEAVELESLVPTGDRCVPFFWVYDDETEHFEDRIRSHSAVEDIEAVDSYDDRVLYSFEWAPDEQNLFDLVREADAYLLNAMGTADSWRLEVRFPSHDSMSNFREEYENRGTSFEVIRVYNPSEPDVGPWYGLTDRQREAIVLAVENGYYDIPRQQTTKALAEELGISDQAVTERLRRAISTLVTNTVLMKPD